MMTEVEIARLDTTSAQVRTEARRAELAALINRLVDHIERVGASPRLANAYDTARTELAALDEKATPR